VRKASLVLAIAACAASSLSLAQSRDPAADVAAPAAASQGSADAGDNGTARDKSGFGQVMSMLTTLLQEAAAKQANSGSSDASLPLSSEQSAVTITVTPVAGRSSFFVDKPRRGQPAPANATPPARVAAKDVGVHAAQGTQMAMQAESSVPD